MEGSGGCNILEVVGGMARCSSSSRFAVAALLLVLLMIGPVASQTQAQYSNAGKEESSCVFVCAILGAHLSVR